VLQIIRRVPPNSAAVVVTVAVAVAVVVAVDVAVLVAVAVCVTVVAGPAHADNSNTTIETRATATIDQCLTFISSPPFYFIFSTTGTL
jgi:hypothetical protein